MTFFRRLQSHKGGLLRLRTQLLWYNSLVLDANPGRVCLLLDAATAPPTPQPDGTAFGLHVGVEPPRARPLAALLLVDGQPRWIWVAEEDVEVLG